MRSRDRIKTTLSHKEPDVLPIDIRGIHVSNVYRLRQHYGLDSPGTPVKVSSIFTMTGRVDDDLKKIIGSDICGPEGKYNSFGIPDKDFFHLTLCLG